MTERKVLVVGAGSAGRMAVSEMLRVPAAGFLPVAFIDDDPAKQGTEIEGIQVLGGRDAIPAALVETGANEIIVALPSVHGRVIRDIVAIDFFTVPTATFRILFTFVVLHHDRRHAVHFNVTAHPTAEWTAQQIVEAFPGGSAPRFLIRDRDGVRALVAEIRPDLLVHAAAQSSHDLAALRPFDDFDVNAVGTLNLLESCRVTSPETIFAQLVAEGLRPGMRVRVSETSPQRIRFEADAEEHVLAPVVAANLAVMSLPEEKEMEGPFASLSSLRPKSIPSLP